MNASDHGISPYGGVFCGKGFAVTGGYGFFTLFHRYGDNPTCAGIVRQFSSQIGRKFWVSPNGRMEFQTLRLQLHQLHIMHHLRGQNHRSVLFQKTDNVGKCGQIGIGNGGGLRGRDGGHGGRRGLRHHGGLRRGLARRGRRGEADLLGDGREIDVVLTKGVRIEGSDASTASNAPTSLPGRTDPSERYLKVTTDEE